MTTTKQIIAIAELDGWTDIGVDAEHVQWWIQLKPEAIQKISYDEIKRLRRYKLPDYLHSRDAIVPVIEKQSFSVQVNVATKLYQMNTIQSGEQWNVGEVIAVLLSSPSQLSEALLRATGKWVEE